MKYFTTLLLVLSFSMVTAGNSWDKEDFFTSDDLQKMERGEWISRMYVKFDKRNENSHNPVVIKMPSSIPLDYSDYEVLISDMGFIPMNNPDKMPELLTSFSQLTGMKYYSRSKGDVKALVKSSFRTDKPGGKKKADKAPKKSFTESVSFFKQKDNKFGTLNYRSELRRDGNNYYQRNICVDAVKKMMIRVNNKEEYENSFFLIYDNEKKGYFFYSFLALRVDSKLLLKSGQIKPTTFSNRLRASVAHLAILMGYDASDRRNPWPGLYDTY